MAVETEAANRAAIDSLALREDDRVLDFGCGPGRSLIELARRVPKGRIAGVDHSEEMVRMARRAVQRSCGREAVAIEHVCSATLPFADDHFDKAMSVHTIYFLPDMRATLTEIGRTIRPGGALALVFRPASDPATADFPGDVYRFDAVSEVVSVLRAAGFEPESSGPRPLAGGPVLLVSRVRERIGRRFPD
jgi:ubiquinone/menaquinone biosynthesis C-methylase UbiE